MSMVKTTITKTPLIIKVVSLYVILASQLWLMDHLIEQSNPPVAAQIASINQATEVQNNEEAITGQPAQLSIERIDVKLAIVDGTYDAARDNWTLSDDAAHFATMTALPNNKQGTTFIYGHNTAAVLEPVKNIAAGDILTITTTNGHVFKYAYVNDMSVTPDQTNVLNPHSNKPQLTLMTCQGLFSETRRIMYFEFVGIE